MKLADLLADINAVIQFFAGFDPNHTVRLAQEPGEVQVVVEAPKPDEPAPDEQKEGA